MASKRRLRRVQCSRKEAFAEAAAYMAAKRLWKSGKRMRAYKCPFAEHWHLGHWGGKAYVG